MKQFVLDMKIFSMVPEQERWFGRSGNKLMFELGF
jgi:hypothetical protein